MNEPKSLMTLYAEGSLISKELQQMMVDYAAEVRFDREMVDDIDLYADRMAARDYSRDMEVEDNETTIELAE